MKAVLLAAGKGTRMKALTAQLPKPMLGVAGRPVLEHILRGLTSAGVRQFLLITGYRAEVIEEFFGDGRTFGVSLRYIRQPTASGTGSAALLARDFIGDEPFLLTYGDILTAPENYRMMIQEFCRGGRLGPDGTETSPRTATTTPLDGLVSTWQGEDLTKGGAVLVGEDGCVCDIVEKGKAADLKNAFYNAGIYILPPQIFAALATLPKSPRGEYELTDAIKQIIRDGKKLRAYALEKFWLDVRDPEALNVAEKIFSAP